MPMTIEIEVQGCETLTLEIIDAPVSDGVSIDDAAGIGDTDVTWSADKSASELDAKVDKVAGLGLSELSFTTANKSSLDQSEQDRHTHSNKTVIDDLSDDAGVLQYKGLPISDQAALDAKVDKVAGKSLVDDTEIAKLATVQENATANRDDALNADKIHEHVIADVTGLDDALLAKFDKADIAQTTGTAADKVMSQKAVTDALGNKVDKELGYSLFPEAEITRLATMETGATKNRDDSENADKIHGHTISDVTGLSTRLNDIDSLIGDVEAVLIIINGEP